MRNIMRNMLRVLLSLALVAAYDPVCEAGEWSSLEGPTLEVLPHRDNLVLASQSQLAERSFVHRSLQSAYFFTEDDYQRPFRLRSSGTIIAVSGLSLAVIALPGMLVGAVQDCPFLMECSDSPGVVSMTSYIMVGVGSTAAVVGGLLHPISTNMVGVSMIRDGAQLSRAGWKISLAGAGIFAVSMISGSILEDIADDSISEAVYLGVPLGVLMIPGGLVTQSILIRRGHAARGRATLTPVINANQLGMAAHVSF